MRQRAWLGAFTLGAALLGGCTAVAVGPGGTSTTVAPTVTIGAGALGIAAAGGLVYCACEDAASVEAYAVDSGAMTMRLAFEGGKPGLVRTFLDRRQVLIQDTTKGELRVIDAGTAAAHKDPSPDAPAAAELLRTLTVGKGVGRLAFGEDNVTVASSAGASDRVMVFTFDEDRGKDPARTDLIVGAAAGDGQARPIDLKGGLLLTVDFASRELRAIHVEGGATDTLGTLGQVGPLAFGMVDGKPAVAIAADPADDSLLLTDVASGQATRLRDLGHGIADLAVDPDTHRAYLAMRDSGEVAVVDYVARTLVTRLKTGDRTTALSLAPPVPGEVWVASESGALTVIDGAAAVPAIKAALTIGHGQHRMTFWGTRGYVSNRDDGTMSLVDRITFR